MNDHIAQFVKGAHILTGLSVILLATAASGAAIIFRDLDSPSNKTEIKGVVEISSKTLTMIQKDVTELKTEIADVLEISSKTLTTLQRDVAELKKDVEIISQQRKQSGWFDWFWHR
jgi:flagellar motility protein MotE (MotC chaperone)